MSDFVIDSCYDEAYKEDMTGLGELFFNNMKIFGDKIAQIEGETAKTQTYSEILQRSIRVAQHLEKFDITPEDVVCLCSHNNLDVCLPFVASQLLGIKVASLDPSLSVKDCEHLLRLVEPKFIFCDVESEELMNIACDKIGFEVKIVVIGGSEKNISFETFVVPTGDEDDFKVRKVDIFDTAVIFFSSGTTGLPKGICTHHYGLISQQRYFSKEQNTTTLLYLTTFYWISAVMLFIVSVLDGSTRVLCKKPTEKHVMEILDKYKVTFCFMSPSFAKKIAKNINLDQFDTSNLETLLIAGEKIYEEQMRTIRNLFATTNVCNVYGMTEASGCISLFRPKDNHFLKTKFLSCGKGVPGFSYKIVNPETKELCGPNVEGELMLKGKCLMNGYYRDPKASELVWSKDGFLHTGDVAYYDEDKCLYIVDRIKEMLKYQSWHVIPSEIESILLKHPDVKEAAVIGIPHSEDGEHPMGVVVLKPAHNVNKEDILKFVNEQVSDRKQLRGGLKFVDYLPVTPSGKIRRRKLRDSLLK